MLSRKSRLLWWDGQNGLAYFDGVHADLRCAPRLIDLQVAEIDYAPEVRKRQVRYPEGTWRDLNQAEEVEIDARLGRMVNNVQDVWS